MKKIIYLIFPILLLVLVSECAGYKPIFQAKNLEFNINNYSMEGDNVLGKNIRSKIYNLAKASQNKENLKNLNFSVDILKNKDATSKDSAGQILEYKITILIKIEVLDSDSGNKILDQKFSSSTSFKVQDEQSETVKLENRSLENLVNSTYQKLLIRLTENIITK